MSNRLTYAGWVAMTLRDKGLENDQTARAKYWSNSGRIEHYDAYKEYCKTNKNNYDSPPDGYWESLEKPWHKPTGFLMMATAILLWFLSGIIGGATGTKRY